MLIFRALGCLAMIWRIASIPSMLGITRIHQDHIRLEGISQFNGFQAITCLPITFIPIHFRQQSADAFSDNALIVDDQEPDCVFGS